MSDDQNSHNDDTGSDGFPAPTPPVPVRAASSSLPNASDVPLTPVVGGGPTLRPDSAGEDVSQKPWLWLVLALIAVLLAAIVFTQCSGSEATPATSIVGTEASGTSGTSATDTGQPTTVAPSATDSTTAVTDPTTSVPSTPPTTATPGTGSATGTGTGTSGSDLTTRQLIGLQAQCIYGGDQPSCDELVAEGYTADSNYGVGTQLDSASDAQLAADCSANIDSLACLELAQRNPGTEADKPTAESFATAVVAGDVATVQSLAAPYVVQENPELVGGPYESTATDIPGTKYSGGKFAFKINDTTKSTCWISEGKVVFCLVSAA